MIIEPSDPTRRLSQKMKMPDSPPSYAEVNRERREATSSGSSGSFSSRPTPSPLDKERPSNVQTTVDQVHIYNRKSAIRGSFYIDPMTPSLDGDRHKRHRNKGQRKNDPPANASFRTRHSEIDVSLATSGVAARGSRAHISASNMSKDIKINLPPMEPSQPRMVLNASSKNGNVVLLIPSNFSGVIRMQTTKGTLEILPALSQVVKIAKATEHEIIFMRNGVDDSSLEANYCELTARTGKVLVGLRDRDHYSPQPGFWQRLGFGRKESENSAS